MSLNESILVLEDNVEDQISPLVYVGAAIVLGFIGFFGFTMNLLVALVIVKDAQILWTPVNVILVNLIVGDFLVAALGNPIAMVSAITGGWYWDYEVCLWYAWFMSTLGFGSIGNLTVMAVERWLLVARPMNALSIRHAVILGFFVWIYALCLSMPPLFGWGSYGPEAGNVSCSISWEIHDPATKSDSYIGFIFVFGLVVPVTVITSSYLAIVFTLKKVRKRAGTSGRREAKVTKMVALMIIAFLLAWSPYASLALAAQYFNVLSRLSVFTGTFKVLMRCIIAWLTRHARVYCGGQSVSTLFFTVETDMFGETVSVRSSAPGTAGQILYLLQPHHIRRSEQSVSTLVEEDTRRTSLERLVTGQPQHGVNSPEQTGAETLRTPLYPTPGDVSSSFCGPRHFERSSKQHHRTSATDTHTCLSSILRGNKNSVYQLDGVSKTFIYIHTYYLFLEPNLQTVLLHACSPLRVFQLVIDSCMRGTLVFAIESRLPSRTMKRWPTTTTSKILEIAFEEQFLAPSLVPGAGGFG